MQKNHTIFLFSAVVICVMTGCSTIHNCHSQKAPMMQSYLEGDDSKAMSIVSGKLKEPQWYNSSVVNTGDELVWRLEAGSLNFNLGNYQACIDEMKRAEELIADYDERAIVSLRDMGSEAATTLTNLNALPYRGLCRDRIALSIFKSLAYLGKGDESAFRAQLNRLRNEQKRVKEDYDKYFEAEKKQMDATLEGHDDIAKSVNESATPEAIAENSANQEFTVAWNEAKAIGNKGYGDFLNPAAIFLSGLGSVRDDNYENARIDFERLCKAMPNNPVFKQYYVTSLKKTGRPVPSEYQNVAPFDFPLDHDCVYVIVAHGRTAAFRQIAIYFPIMFAFPVCEYYLAPYTFISVEADGRGYQAVPLADMDAIHSQEFMTRLPGILVRTITSTLIKEAAYHATMESLNRSDSGVGTVAQLAVGIGGTAYRIAMNTADTRSWEILPKEFLLTQFPMPANRKVNLQLRGQFQQDVPVDIPADCRSAILYINAPSAYNVSCQVLPIKSK
ncbi:MAG: hypothetical protein K5787_06620 [Lentisphaeria bacterium]|nr:hypothetical protein [Lentisphaeria bacterium]